ARFSQARRRLFEPAGFEPLVFGHVAIDFVGPGEDAAFEILDLVKTLLPEKLHGLGAAHAALAMNDHFHVLIQFAKALGQFGQRNQGAARNPANCELLRIAHVQDEYLVALLQPLVEFLDAGFPTLSSGGRGRRSFLAANPAKLVVVNEPGDGGPVTAQGALLVSPDLEFLEAHLQGVIKEKPPDQGGAFAQDQLDRLGGLNAADPAGQDAKDAAFGTAGHLAGWRRLRIQAAITRARRRMKHRCLPIKTEDAAVNVWLVQEHAGIVNQVARLEVIGAV